ncbi:MAG TPA: aminotransferase class I/II-fold pyridoxal phosphate-dependent enzyme [Firmicutes bacterium]|nr:aminotransferase class I/II-fold pyridoxal phosphate-dependent enzyme [Bacillota bacterium]
MSEGTVVDLRSDTVTRPTPEMWKAMADAELGDDTLGDWSAVTRLEEMAAEVLGKEAALFVPSGMMANSLALRLFLRPGDWLACLPDAHIVLSGLAGFAGISARVVLAPRGHMDAGKLETELASGLVPYKLLCLENTYNHGGGVAMAAKETARLAAVARRHGLPLYVDGARIFNASVALQEPVARLVEPADAVMFCLSKGLSAPVGSLLAGSRSFVEEARELRHLLGGSMRQAGILAAAGLVALRTMTGRLAEDHARARQLAEGLADMPFIRLSLPPAQVQTNIVFFQVSPPVRPSAFVAELEREGVLCLCLGDRVRMVTHRHVGETDVSAVLRAVQRVIERWGDRG